jgi:predicted RND superfamily exporter protein
VVWLEVETDFTKNFRAGSPIVRSYQFVETNLGGAGVWDVIVPAPRTLDAAHIERVGRLEERLRAIPAAPTSDAPHTPALTKVISLTDAIQAARSDRRLARWPVKLLNLGLRQTMPVFTAAMQSETPDANGRYYLRIALRAPERQPAARKQWLIDEVSRIAREEFPPTPDEPGAEVTGFFVLLTNLVQSVIRDQWICFAAAAIGIGLMMMVAFRSPVLAVVALFPNALPILVVLGTMGWLGIGINMGAAMIAAVSMGLSVDSSIHYLYWYCRARRAGKTTSEALAEVQPTVGRAMAFSTLALIVGFSGLCISQFVPTIYFGALVGLAMLGGLFGNLLVLPLLLKLTAPLDNWFTARLS